MDRRNNLLIDVQKPEWDWFTVECALRTSEDGKRNSVWQLAPAIFLTNPTSTQSDPNVKLFIDTEKSLNYSTELGWNWHKSWNLPNISVKLEIKNQNGEQLLSPKNLYAQIFAVKKNVQNEISDKMTLFDVGIRGESKMEMIDGHVYFSALKFSSTTYNNEGHNFHLLIAIYIHEGDGEKPKVLTAVISPEIFVDSRRSARDYQEKKFNSFIEPFSLDQLEKQFIKRENKSKIEQEVLINNDPQGFYNYLTAPNIRHKVKHPIFLAIRFSNCVTIYIHKSLLTEKEVKEEKEQNKIKEIMLTLQKKLVKDNQTKTKQANEKPSLNDKLFLFVVKNLTDSLKRKKIMEALQSLESSTIQVMEDTQEISSDFLKLSELGNLVDLYKQSYDELKQFCRKYIPFDLSSSEEDSQEDDAKSSKKMKVNKFEGGVSYSYPNNHQKRRQANIVCNTIHTKDVPAIEKRTSLKEVKKQDFEEDVPQKLPQGNAFSLSISKKNSAFNLRNQTTLNNKYHEPEIRQQQIPQPQQQQPTQQPQHSLENILSNNMLLNNCLNSIKENNQRLEYQYQPQSSLYLLEQIKIYWELLAQITYQNELLARSLNQRNQSNDMPIVPPNGTNIFNQPNSFNSQPDLRNLFNGGGMNNLNGMPNLSNLQGMQNIPNPQNLLSIPNLLNMPNLAHLNLNNLNLNATSNGQPEQKNNEPKEEQK